MVTNNDNKPMTVGEFEQALYGEPGSLEETARDYLFEECSFGTLQRRRKRLVDAYRAALLAQKSTRCHDRHGRIILEGDVLQFAGHPEVCGIVTWRDGGYCLEWDETIAKIRREKFSDGLPGNLFGDGNPWEVRAARFAGKGKEEA